MSAAAAYVVGGECDAWCTKCKRDTWHNIVALDASEKLPAQVICRSCKGTHKYRAAKVPVTDAATPKPAAGAKAAAGKAKTGKKPAKKGSKSPAAPTPAQTAKRWEEMMQKTAGTAEQNYAVTKGYDPGAVLRHTTFGLGFVTQSVGWNRITVLFQDAERTLVSRHGQKPPEL